MTTIAYRHGLIAADTQIIGGNTIGAVSVAKIAKRKKDGALCGASGYLSFCQAFHRWFLAGERGKFPTFHEGDRAFIAVKGKQIEMFESVGSFEYDPEYLAIGSGSEFAMGAMCAGANAIDAVAAAVKHDPGSGGDIMSFRHGR
jgi:ATP-dependent HslUV protease subunit HslV